MGFFSCAESSFPPQSFTTFPFNKSYYDSARIYIQLQWQCLNKAPNSYNIHRAPSRRTKRNSGFKFSHRVMSPTPYLLGRDPEECRRLSIQHQYLTHLAGGRLFLPPTFPGSKTEFAVLDAACGGASFLEEVAKEYPKAQLYGCDISPKMFPFYDPSQKETVGLVNTGHEDMKTALHLRVQDLTSPDGLPKEWNEKFDLIHVRYVMAWIDIDKYPQVLKNLHRALKPGGWIQFIEQYFPKEVYTESPAVKRALRLLCRAIFERPGSSTTKASTLPHFLPAFGFSPSSLHAWSVNSASGSLEPDPAIRELAFVHVIPIYSIVSKRFYANNTDDTWISGFDNERERFPLNDAEWEGFLCDAIEGLKTEGVRFPNWLIYAQREN